MSLFDELKRRNVIRVAIAYAVAAWLLIEISATTFPILKLPEWSVTLVTVLVLIGFPLALIFAWAFELTSEGLKREHEVDRSESITHLTGRKLDFTIIAAMAIAIAYFMADKFVWIDEEPATAVAVSDARPSVAVLPFANRSANPDDAFFVDGIHDDLLSHVAKIGSIKTISRTSVLRYRDSTKSIPQIASELGVGTVLEGGVQRAGEQVRINVQLIDARTDDHLWSEIYDRQLSAANVFAIQSEIAEAIAAALQATLSPAEQMRIRSAPTDNLAAYEAYLFGKQRMAGRTTDGLAVAVEYFRQAVDHDPLFALAWVGLADTYLLQVEYSGLSEREIYPRAEAALEKALELDKDLGEAYASLGLLKFNSNDLEGAERSFKRALELSPNYARSYQWYAYVLRALGRSEEASASVAIAVQLDPMSAIIRQNYAVSLRREGRYDEAMKELETVLVIDPGFIGAHDAIATMQNQLYNRYDEATRGYRKLITLDPNRAGSYVWLGQIYLDLADPERANRLIKRAIELAPESSTTVWGQELLDLYRGDLDGAVEAAKKVLTRWGKEHWIAQFSAAQLRNHALASGRISEALEVYAEAYPQLVAEQEPDIGLHNYRAAIDLAMVLQKADDTEKASRLLDRVFELIRSQPRLGWWGGYWVSDVQILALQGRKPEALAALRQAVDDGWRSLWWYYLKHDPNLGSIRGESEFQALVDLIKADMAAQLKRVEEMERNGEMPPTPGVMIEAN